MFWRERYELGVELIDAQHKELFERVEAFMLTVRSTEDWEKKVPHINETLAFMKAYVVEHFRDEEEYQLRIGYPDYAAHKKTHDGMVSYVLDACAAYEENGYDQQLMQQFAGRLLAWLINHVASDDQRIAAYAMEKGEAGHGN